MNIFTILLGVLGIVGTIGTFYFGVKSKVLERQRYRFSWEDVARGSQAIAKKCIRQFKPHLILTFSGPGSILANLAMMESGQSLPLYTVIELKKDDPNSASEISGYFKIETFKWKLFMPEHLPVSPSTKITVIHDCAISGDGLSKVRAKLIEMGFNPKNVKIASLVCSKIALDSKKAPDFYLYCLEHASFYFPWGEHS